MPQLDVTDVLLDPILAGEEFAVLRRQEVVDQHGVAVIQVTQLQAVGSIVPARDELVREEAFQTNAGAIRVITGFRLRDASRDAAGQSWQPDLVVWQGDQYIVRSVNDYVKFGAGFVEAECVSVSSMDTPAQ